LASRPRWPGGGCTIGCIKKYWRKIIYKKRVQQSDPISKLCLVHLETLEHMCQDYSYTREVWAIILPWVDLRHLQNLDLSWSIYKYWRKGRRIIMKKRGKGIWWHRGLFLVEYISRRNGIEEFSSKHLYNLCN
jgi:hypothetical protein